MIDDHSGHSKTDSVYGIYSEKLVDADGPRKVWLGIWMDCKDIIHYEMLPLEIDSIKAGNRREAVRIGEYFFN